MHEENLRNVLNSLSHLADHGEIPVHAFGTLLRAAKTETITEHLHQKWLSDSNFPRLAAQIVYHFHTLDNHDVSSLTSGCLAHALRDYKCRDEIRKKSKKMYRNYVHTLVEFYIVYRHIDLCLAQTLVAPLFTCLDSLFDESTADEEDIKCGAQLLIGIGKLLTEQSVGETTALVMKCRQHLISNSIQKSEETNVLLVAVGDLWGAGWQKSRLPEILQIYHADKFSFVDHFARYDSPAIGIHRSRSSSGYGSPARIHPLQTATGSKRLIVEQLRTRRRNNTVSSENSSNRDDIDNGDDTESVV
jgi:hypothetical protein